MKAEQACGRLLHSYPQSLTLFNVLGAALKMQGKLQEALACCDKVIQFSPDYADAYSNRGIVLQELGQLEEAVASYAKATQLDPDYADAYYNCGNAYKELGQLKEALACYDKATKLNLGFADAYSNRGVVLTELGQLEEAVVCCDKAIQLDPSCAVAYNNRGNALQELGRLEAALASYDKAIQLNPSYADAYSNRGVALQEIGKLEEAVASYDKAIQLKPNFAETYSNRANALKEFGQLEEAVASYLRAISIDSQNSLFWAGFADSLQTVKFTTCDDGLVHYLLQMLEQPSVCPQDVSRAVISALRHYPRFMCALELFKHGHVDEIIDQLTTQFSSVPLFLKVMELSPIADLDVEIILTHMRKAMLCKVKDGGDKTQALPFYAALALNCFANEYVFSESEEEKKEIDFLEESIRATMEKGRDIPPSWIAVLGAYRPLYSFSWADDLLESAWSDDIKKVIVKQVTSVREEQALRSKIQRLTSIEDQVSHVVRNQYEENPYPRWINTGLSDKPKTIRQVLQSLKVRLDFDMQQFSNRPDILVAGCGTGQHALSTASRFLNCNVLAVDLSLSSLSYAIRKTQELEITNIEYMQGDILKLNKLERQFDIIESGGVLHHMDDPIAGWKILVDRLRTSGLMKIGLYSDIARRHIVEARRQIAKKKYTTSPDDIRGYREKILNTALDSDSEITKVIGTPDFYSLSECRDLLFHVQEHRFTLPQIEEALNDLGLKFLGFELKQSWIKRRFCEFYPEKDASISLSLWHQFELKHPDTFMGMYQFWVQKA